MARALRSEVRVRLLKILSEGELSAIDAFRKYNEHFERKHRESIYRDLELLVACEMLKKKYDEKRKEIVYTLITPELKVNFRNGEVCAV